MTATAEKMPVDVAELWKRTRSGRRTGHYYLALFGVRRYDPVEVVAWIRRGVTYPAFERFQRNTELPQRLLARAAGISERTLARRKESGRLEPEETDRLVRIARVVARAIELFEGDTDAAREWLTGSAHALGGRTPLEFAGTDAGAIEVASLIGRLEQGIPA
ncbi:MAG: type II RES/Xre toxin-antitoxin system antitoxin [Gemmatimonadaceae bacterium]